MAMKLGALGWKTGDIHMFEGSTMPDGQGPTKEGAVRNCQEVMFFVETSTRILTNAAACNSLCRKNLQL